MPKNLVWIIIALVALGLFINTLTHSPERTNPVDLRMVSESEPSVTVVPAQEVDPNARGKAAVDTLWLIRPGKSVGSITGNTSLEKLQQLYGAKNVINGPVPGPEGTTLDGVLLFPTQPTRALTIYWKAGQMPLRLKVPGSIAISGKETVWHTVDGVTLGTSLKKLEELNGGPFTLSGFGWDYGGRVLSWGDSGKLRNQFQKDGSLILRLSPPPNASTQLREQVLGDQTFSSSHPAMQALNPTVSEIIVML